MQPAAYAAQCHRPRSYDLLDSAAHAVSQAVRCSSAAGALADAGQRLHHEWEQHAHDGGSLLNKPDSRCPVDGGPLSSRCWRASWMCGGAAARPRGARGDTGWARSQLHGYCGAVRAPWASASGSLAAAVQPPWRGCARRAGSVGRGREAWALWLARAGWSPARPWRPRSWPGAGDTSLRPAGRLWTGGHQRCAPSAGGTRLGMLHRGWGSCGLGDRERWVVPPGPPARFERSGT